MRGELGTSKGEGLCHLGGEAINDFCGQTAPWDGGVFPTTTLDGIRVPEAFLSGREIEAKRRLLHQLDDWKLRFPRAVAWRALEMKTLMARTPWPSEGSSSARRRGERILQIKVRI